MAPMREAISPIMVVDDNPDDIALLRRRLTSAAIRNPLLEFTDGAAALAFLRALGSEPEAAFLRPCVVFLDINMPVVHGFVLLKWIRHQPELDDIKVLVLSGSDKPADRERSIKLGADEYLVKFPPTDALTAALTQGVEGCLFADQA